MIIKYLLPIVVLLSFGFSHAQTAPFDRNDFDPALLNTFIAKELNRARKQARSVPFNLNADLKSAADDQCSFMSASSKLTTTQKHNKAKKHPKNRVDFYDGNFKHVEELISIAEIHENKKNTYQSIAKELVAYLLKSRINYRIITNAEFENTYAAFQITAANQIIANHLIASREYDKTYSEQPDTSFYDNYLSWQGLVIIPKVNPGRVVLGKDSCIYYYGGTSLFSKLFLQNRWRTGLAADIVLKSQYPCDSTDFFNPELMVRGIGLEPVYKKDFQKFGLFGCRVNLGKFPSYIKEDFAINLVIVRKKRSWINIQYDFLPSSYSFDPELKFEFDSLSLETRKQFVDQLETTLVFDKLSLQPNDSSYFNFSELIKTENKVVRVELDALASIENSLESNSAVYQKRVDLLIKELKKRGIDSSLVHFQFKENFDAFRKDIRYTNYSWLDTLSDQKLRQFVNLHQSELEFLLKSHRTIHCKIETRKDTLNTYTKELWEQETARALEKGYKSALNKSLEYAYSLYLDNQITVEDIEHISVPNTVKYTSVLENQAILIYMCSSKDDNSLVQLILSLKRLDPKYSHTLATSIALAEYLHFLNQPKRRGMVRSFYRYISENNQIKTKVKSRMLLHLATIHDRNLPRFYPERRCLHWKAKRHINSAKLNVDQLYQLSTYYYYFNEDRFAYKIIKSKAAKTEDPEQLIYFLKLIEYNNFKLPHGEKIACYKKLAKKRPELFCASFNYYGINIQVLDDTDVKKVYCKTCSE